MFFSTAEGDDLVWGQMFSQSYELDMSDGVVQLSVQADVGNMRPFLTSALLISNNLWVSGGQGC